MICGYGYKRTEADLEAIGAETVWIDTNRERTERAAMMQPGALRKGYTLRLLGINDLAGNPRANEKWLAMLKERGVTVEVIEPPKPAPKKRGPKPKFNPNAAQDAQIKALMDDPWRTAAYRVRRASEIMGQPVTYHQLYHRYVVKAQD